MATFSTDLYNRSSHIYPDGSEQRLLLSLSQKYMRDWQCDLGSKSGERLANHTVGHAKLRQEMQFELPDQITLQEFSADVNRSDMLAILLHSPIMIWFDYGCRKAIPPPPHKVDENWMINYHKQRVIKPPPIVRGALLSMTLGAAYFANIVQLIIAELNSLAPREEFSALLAGIEPNQAKKRWQDEYIHVCTDLYLAAFRIGRELDTAIGKFEADTDLQTAMATMNANRLINEQKWREQFGDNWP
jgi:hypothetical protein